MCINIDAQKITGTVEEAKDLPLSHVSVVGLDGRDKITCYAITDLDGKFSLLINDSVVNIRFTTLGYKTVVKPVKETKDGMVITMPKDKFTIKEVTVKANRIKTEGDTLTYSVAGFRQGQDRSIGDVIAKMPGMEVGADGTIKYQGKSINKYYIEGLDLMGRQYGIANKNISADKIQSVQVLKNHQPVKSLHDVQFSDQAALNLVLKDDAKETWAATADVGLGYGDEVLYDNRILALRFARKFQTLMMYKNNDTGKNIKNEIRDLANPDNSITLDNVPLLGMDGISIQNLDRERYEFNKSHVIAGNWLWKNSKESELRLQGNGYIDKNDLERQRQTTYLTIDGSPAIMEVEDVSNKTSEWKGEANYQYNGANTYINNNLRGFIDFNKSTGQTLLDGNETKRMVKPHRRYVTDAFNFSHTTPAKHVYKWKANVAYDYMPGKLLLSTGDTEELNQSYLKAATEFSGAFSISKLTIDNTVGLDYNNQSLDLKGESDKQTMRYQSWSFFYSPSLQFVFAKHKLTLAAKALALRQTYEGNNKNNLWIDPRLYYKWDITPKSELTFTTAYNHTPKTINDIFSVPLYTSYRTQRVNAGNFITNKNFSVSAAYSYSNPINGTFFYIRPTYSRISGNAIYKSMLKDEVYLMTATDSSYSTNALALSGRVGKSFSWAKTYTAIGFSVQRTSYKMLVSNSINDGRMWNESFYFDYSLRPSSWLSAEGRSSVQITKQENLTDDRLSAGETVYWKHHLGMFFFLTEKLMLSWNHDLLHSNKKTLGTNYFMDVALSYKQRRSELSISVNNIIGKDNIEREQITNTLETYTYNRLRPREIIAKWSFDF